MDEDTTQDEGPWDKFKGFLHRLSRPGYNEGDTQRVKKRDGSSVQVTYTGGRWLSPEGSEYSVQPGGLGGESLGDEIGGN